MSGLERNVMYKPGASFFEDGGKVMFRYQADSSSVIGPRLATKADKEQFALEWGVFNEGRLPQLDGDHNGRPGGSFPHAPIRPVSDEHVHAPADYEEPQAKRRGRPPKGV